MKCMACAIGASVVVAASAFAGEPVEWPVSVGGNGHWYEMSAGALDWTAASSAAHARGGYLATVTSSEEWSALVQRLQPDLQLGYSIWAGGFQEKGSCEPGCGWQWVTGEPWSFAIWQPGEPNDWNPDNNGVNQGEGCLEIFSFGSNTWNDCSGTAARRYLMEWSADCNGDGIVDFGQIRSGQLADLNADNIPDVCQCPTPHVVRVPQDAPSIAAAVALACPGNPLEVVVAPGTWVMDARIPTASSAPIVVRGAGGGETIITDAAEGTRLIDTIDGTSYSDCRLKDLTVADVSGSESAVTFENCLVRDCVATFLCGPVTGTRFERCSPWSYSAILYTGWDVTDCDFVDCATPILWWATEPRTVRGLTFTNTFGHAIRMYSGCCASSLNDYMLENCTFTGTDGTAVELECNSHPDAPVARVSFVGCQFDGTMGPAIEQLALKPGLTVLTNCSFMNGSTWAIRDVLHDAGTMSPSHSWDLALCAFEANAGSLQFGRNRSVTLDSCQFTSNQGANIEQGATFTGRFRATNCTFAGNEAGIGGAYACSSVEDASFLNCTFTGNRGIYGGAIWAEYSRCFVTDCVFSQNSATSTFWESGGAIEIVLGTAVITGCDFTGNSAPFGSGGAIACNNVNYLYFNDLPLRIEDCDFVGNSAAYYGGAVYFHWANIAGIGVRGCRFQGNTALGGTAVLGFNVGFDIEVSNCAVSNEGPASTFRVIDSTGGNAGVVVGASTICAGSPTPFAGATDAGTNCIASSCEDLDGNGRPDECELFHDVPSQYPTIQAAIDAAPAGVHRIVRVAAGTYNEAFALSGKNVVVRGAPNHATILDGTGLTTSIARFTGGEPATAGVESLVFRNGTAGSQIYPKAPFRVGGALYAANSGAFVRNCEFRQNRSDFGGAMYCYLCRTVVDDSTFIGNIADDEGGAILAFETTATVRNSGFDGNRCGAVNPGSGSGFKSVGARVAGETVLLDNCSFSNGVAGVNGAAVEHYENTVSVPGKLRILNCDIVGNSSGIGAAGVRVQGSMQSCTVAAATTICGNSGRNIDGPFFIEGAVTICDCLADLARDGSVNGGDLGMLLSAWGLTNAQGIGDANHNGMVDGADLSVVLSSWGPCP